MHDHHPRSGASTNKRLVNMFGPLFILKWKGTLCPCLENSEERAARNALVLVENLPILWCRDKESSTAASLVGKFFSSSSKKTSGGIPSTLIWMDGEHGPLLQVEPTKDNEDNDSSPLQQSAGYMKTLSLSEIQDAECKPNSKTISLNAIVGGKPRKLLCFRVVEHDEISSEDVVQAIQVLTTWEKNRIPVEEREFRDEESMNRAQKAAHFCQREIELKRLKSEREQRKQKYLNMSRKNGGGMKYTAIAMANRADSNTIT